MTPEEISKKREGEVEVCTLMIGLYCKKKHGMKGAMRGAGEMCADCRALAEYVSQRVERCPFMETKTFCAFCRVHCYKSEMREKIRVVMRFSGPRMIFHRPVLAFRHLALTVREKRKRREINEAF